ncbi:hypothetical protein NKR23_g11487 [Pleurostoma richardsiae]|uniref:Tat pathway signal sequence n=1 Tax=Pleurostoma richardsiae TaxID=41990 RepID=A0AA38RJ90_9PEZI|nr:hypothetical protein NKR23_g11487 [Pleurostoma richardsiae]
MAPGSSRMSLPSIAPMPVIVEDETAPPHLPARSKRRSAPALAGSIGGGHARHPSSGTLSTTEKSVSNVPDRDPGPQREGFRDQEWVARRGGWYRLVVTVLVVVALAVGLSVGLTIGLRKKHKSQSQSASTVTANSLFPAGSYAFTTALVNTSTACTSEASTFRCYPYATYTPLSPNASAATFHWVITAVSSYAYTISSSANPFAPSFSNVSLTLLDGNQATERLVFSVPAAKAVVPAGSLPGAGDRAATCWFNSTVLSATLWTRARASYPPGVAAVPDPVNASATFQPWPYAAEIRQVAAAGPGVPDCRDGDGAEVGDSFAEAAGAGDCGCWYANHGLVGNGTVAAGRRWDG